MKPPRFLLSQNKLAKTDDLFIVHTYTPAFIARVVREAGASERLHAPIRRGGLVELVRIFEPSDDETIHKILTQMADWYNYAHKK